jgi:hypothetical protein
MSVLGKHSLLGWYRNYSEKKLWTVQDSDALIMAHWNSEIKSTL